MTLYKDHDSGTVTLHVRICMHGQGRRPEGVVCVERSSCTHKHTHPPTHTPTHTAAHLQIKGEAPDCNNPSYPVFLGSIQVEVDYPGGYFKSPKTRLRDTWHDGGLSSYNFDYQVAFTGRKRGARSEGRLDG